LEINPLVVKKTVDAGGGKATIELSVLDLAARLDQTAEYEV